MKAKKTEVITFRIDEETKSKIDRIVEKTGWSQSQAIENICKEYFAIQKGMTIRQTIIKFHEMMEEEITSIELDFKENEEIVNNILDCLDNTKSELLRKFS